MRDLQLYNKPLDSRLSSRYLEYRRSFANAGLAQTNHRVSGGWYIGVHTRYIIGYVDKCFDFQRAKGIRETFFLIA